MFLATHGANHVAAIPASRHTLQDGGDGENADAKKGVCDALGKSKNCELHHLATPCNRDTSQRDADEQQAAGLGHCTGLAIERNFIQIEVE